MDDVLITGLGALTCLGRGVDRFWAGMLAARSRPTAVSDPAAHLDLPLMYLVPDDERSSGLASQFAVDAARQAVDDAALTMGDASGVAVLIGTGMGDCAIHEDWRVNGYPDSDWSSPFAVCSAVAAAFGIGGGATSVSNACAASAFAVSMAADLIRCGQADVVITGGAEAYSRVALGCFNRLGALDHERCRPFDKARTGTMFGEGAAMLVLESARHAVARRAPHHYARIAGSGWTCDAHHPTAPEPTGWAIERAIRTALDEAGTAAGAVGLVVPHGTGTELNDEVESVVLNRVLGRNAAETPLYSLKALIGHTGGAAGALSALAATLMLDRVTIAPNVAIGLPDPACDVWLPTEPLPLNRSTALVNAYAFGGNNVSMVLEGMPR